MPSTLSTNNLHIFCRLHSQKWRKEIWISNNEQNIFLLGIQVKAIFKPVAKFFSHSDIVKLSKWGCNNFKETVMRVAQSNF
jgi:hypothetical protein